MLYVISTTPDGRVLRADACSNGIDQALNLIAERVTHPEEDAAAAGDVLRAAWEDAVQRAEYDACDPRHLFAMSRPAITNLRFGLVSIGGCRECGCEETFTGGDGATFCRDNLQHRA